MDALKDKKPVTSAQAVLIHSIMMLLRNEPIQYKKIKEVFNNSPLVYILLLEMLECGAITADNLKNGLIMDNSLIAVFSDGPLS